MFGKKSQASPCELLNVSFNFMPAPAFANSGTKHKKVSERPARETAWHRLETEEIVQLLGGNLEHGLGSEEAEMRSRKYGRNRVSRRAGPNAWQRWLAQFHQPLVYILLVAGAVTLYLGEYVDSGVIFGVVLVNAIVGYLQETKAEHAIEALAQMVVTETTVRRDGKRRKISSDEIVPGDIVLLQSGDRVPADIRLYKARNLRVDESALTGESLPVEKHSDPLSLETVLAERKNLAYAGTLVVSGQGEGIVWATGDRTETGRIAWLISEATELQTPLTRKIAYFSWILLFVILGLAAVTFGVGLMRGEGAVEMFMAAVALAVGAIPEGLPAAVTITLAIGVARMSWRRAIVRKLPAVETLGSTTVICSDKTGTLTENQMTVQEIYAGDEQYVLSGTGYEGHGEIQPKSGKVPAHENHALKECLVAGLLCNDSQFLEEEGRLKLEGDPTEAALIVSARKAGLYSRELEKIRPRKDSIPFESELQFMATLHDHPHETGNRIVYKKGALERILTQCTRELRPDGRHAPIHRDRIRHAAESMARRGLRVLAFASRSIDGEVGKLNHDHVSGGLTFLGLQAMMDPPRKEAISAVKKCQTAGIEVKMITGDHILTASSIAEQIGIKPPAGQSGLLAMSGRELEECSDEQLPDVAKQTSVFARVAPEQKLRLVRALQSRGQIVAMTGDGVNDAPALRQADIGVAMGRNGTEVAKGAADIVLTDDNFASIEAAVEEGRGVFDNLTKFIVWTLPTNFGEALIILTAIMAGMALPALPVQLLWINMTTAVFLGLTLVFEPKEKDLMFRPPRDPKLPILDFPLTMRTGLVSLMILLGGFGLFLLERKFLGSSLEVARTVVVNTVVMAELFYLLNCRCLVRSVWAVGFWSNKWVPAGIAAMLGMQLVFTYSPWMHRLFQSAPLDAMAWLRIIGIGLMVFIVVGFEKAIRLRFGKTGLRK